MQTYFSLDENFEDIIKKELENKFNVKKIIAMEQISTGWTNIVYKVKADNGNYYFRFPRDDFWEKTIVKDYECAKYIQGKTSFKTVDLKLGYSHDRPFSIHKEIEGVPLAEKMNDLSKEEIEKISKQLAKFMHELHNLPYDEKEIFTITNIGLELHDFITELLEKHVSKEDNKFWLNNNFKIHSNDQCLVHGDFNSSNVLLDNENNVTAIIDFGFGGFGSKSQDISRIIGRCPENFKTPIIEAYEKFENKELEKKQLNRDIETWNNIDNAYINYMTKIGIYKG